MVALFAKPTQPLSLQTLVVSAHISPEQEALIINAFNDHGGIIVQFPPSPSPEKDLLSLKKVFGSPIFHPLSQPNGIVAVQYEPQRLHYVNNSSDYLSPHLDGGMCTKTPKIVALQSIIASPKDGFTILVRADEIHNFLLQENPAQLLQLYETDALNISRDGETASHAVFSHNQLGNLEMVFRGDETASVKPEAQHIFTQIKAFLANPQNQARFALLPYQILILDNTRVLHGRTAFDPRSQRLLHRLWFDGEAVGLNLGFTL